MKIKCYFEFPCLYDEKINDFVGCKIDEPDVPHIGNGLSDDLYYLSCVLIFRALKKKYPDAEIVPVNNSQMGTLGHCPHCKFAIVTI